MTLKLFASGDVVNFNGKNDFVDYKLREVIQTADIAICNFEAPIKHKDMKPIKKAGPHLYQSKESVEYLKDVGFNMVSLANNHIYDYGQEALENTIKELEKYNISFVGGGATYDSAYEIKITEKNGIKIALLAACENEFGCLYEEQNRGGYAWLFHEKIDDNIRQLKNEVDSVVLIAHAGIEDLEFPIKEWRDRYKRLCDLGVDVIIGHHPHVPQGYEHYNKSMIFYSLGNFYFDTASFENKCDDSYSVVLEFEKKGLKHYEIIYHKKIKGQTRRVKKGKVNFCIDDLNSLLYNDYIKKNNEVSIKLFNKYYYNYYEFALGKLPSNSSFAFKIKYFIKILLGRDVKNNILLLHNIKIDSHRFLVQRALELII